MGFAYWAYVAAIWLAPIGVAFLVSLLLGTSLTAKAQNFLVGCWSSWRGIAAGAIFALFVTFYIPFLMNSAADPTTPYWKFWLQTVAGNWSPDAYPPLAPPAKPVGEDATPTSLSGLDYYQFSVSATVAFFLNNGIIFLLLGLLWRANTRRTAMHPIDSLTLMKSFSKTAAEEKMNDDNYSPEEQKRFMALLDVALDVGEKDVKKHLPRINAEVAQGMGIGPNPE